MKALPLCRVRQPWSDGPKLTPCWTTTFQEDVEPLAPPCRGQGCIRELTCATGLHNTSYSNSCSGMKRCWWLFLHTVFRAGWISEHPHKHRFVSVQLVLWSLNETTGLQTLEMLKHFISARLILDVLLPASAGIPILLRTNIWLWYHWYPVLTQTQISFCLSLADHSRRLVVVILLAVSVIHQSVPPSLLIPSSRSPPDWKKARIIHG